MLWKQKLVSHRKRYSNTEREAIGVLQSLEKFHHYCIARGASIVTDHKSLVASFKTVVVTFLQRLQCILLKNHQYRIRIIYKVEQDLFIADHLSGQNHNENKDDTLPDILGMKINTDAMCTTTDIPNCINIQELQQVHRATTKDEQLQQLREHIIRNWFQNRNEVLQEITSYWTFRDDMAVIDGIILKGR